MINKDGCPWLLYASGPTFNHEIKFLLSFLFFLWFEILAKKEWRGERINLKFEFPHISSQRRHVETADGECKRKCFHVDAQGDENLINDLGLWVTPLDRYGGSAGPCWWTIRSADSGKRRSFSPSASRVIAIRPAGLLVCVSYSSDWPWERYTFWACTI